MKSERERLGDAGAREKLDTAHLATVRLLEVFGKKLRKGKGKQIIGTKFFFNRRRGKRTMYLHKKETKVQRKHAS